METQLSRERQGLCIQVTSSLTWQEHSTQILPKDWLPPSLSFLPRLCPQMSRRRVENHRKIEKIFPWTSAPLARASRQEQQKRVKGFGAYFSQTIDKDRAGFQVITEKNISTRAAVCCVLRHMRAEEECGDQCCSFVAAGTKLFRSHSGGMVPPA